MPELSISKVEVLPVPEQVGAMLVVYFGTHYWKGYFERPADAYSMEDFLKDYIKA